MQKEPRVISARMEYTYDEFDNDVIDIVAELSDGRTVAVMEVDYDFPELAAWVVGFLNTHG